MPNDERTSGKTGSKRLILRRETLKTLAPASLGEVRSGLFFFSGFCTRLCETVTAPDTEDGPLCRPAAHF